MGTSAQIAVWYYMAADPIHRRSLKKGEVPVSQGSPSPKYVHHNLVMRMTAHIPSSYSKRKTAPAKVAPAKAIKAAATKGSVVKNRVPTPAKRGKRGKE